MTPIVAVQALSHRFGAVTAVSDMSLSVGAGEIVGLIGPNGCGKTTLFNCISGRYVPTSGTVTWRDEDITGMPMRSVVRRGLIRTFQESRVFVSDTVRGAVERAARIAAIGRRDRTFLDALPGDTSDILEFCGIAELENTPAAILPNGSLRQLGIAIAMTARPLAMLLDEPAAGLNGPEAETLALTVRQLHVHGVTVVVVDHDMGFLMPLVERVVVMVDGKEFRQGTPDEVRRDPGVISVYLGADGAREAHVTAI